MYRSEIELSFFGSLRNYSDAELKASPIYVYRLEPVIDRPDAVVKYIRRYVEPIDSDRIKQDCGSGRYRICIGGVRSLGVGDSLEIEIYDPSCPPVIPLDAVWLSDPRNDRWAWAEQWMIPKPFIPPEPPPMGTHIKITHDLLQALFDEPSAFVQLVKTVIGRVVPMDWAKLWFQMLEHHERIEIRSLRWEGGKGEQFR